MGEFVWNPENLKTLIEKAEVTVEDFAESCDISKSSMRYYLRGAAIPSINKIIKMADFFAVPLDYICGRCSLEEVNAIESNYQENFRILRKENYERLMFQKETVPVKPKGYEAPYPYNLLDDIFEEPFDHVITEDEMAGLNNVLQSLSERERDIIRYRYHDELTLRDTGKIFGLTVERIRQIEAKALRKLRHPVRKNHIKWGWTGITRKDELDRREHELNKREERLNELEEKLAENGINVHEPDYDEENMQLSGYSQAFWDLDLNVRAFNCLARANIRTVDQIIEQLNTPDILHPQDRKLYHIRNLGKKTYDYILKRIEECTGKDMSEYYNPIGVFKEISA